MERLGETSDDVWAAINRLACGFVCREAGSRVVYVTLRVLGLCDFVYTIDGKFIKPDRVSGMSFTYASESEIDEFHDALSKDQVQVVVLATPGYGSDYYPRKVLKVLHNPRGMCFGECNGHR